MSEQLQEFKIHKMREAIDKYAEALAEHTFLEHNRKVVLARLMKKYMIQSNGKVQSVNAQEREALTDPEYTEYLKQLREAERLKIFGNHNGLSLKQILKCGKQKVLDKQ